MNTPHTLLQSLQQLLDYHDGSSAEPISRNEAVEHARQTLDAAEVRLRANFNRILRETLEELNAAHASSWMEIKAANDTLQFPTPPLVLVPVSDIIAEIVKANLVYRLNGENTCHSHEYVDANQVFIDAFEETYAEEFDPQNDLHQHLYHQGWVIEPDAA